VGDGLINNFELSENKNMAIFELSSFMISILKSKKNDFGFSYTKLPLHTSLTSKNKAGLRLFQFLAEKWDSNNYHSVPLLEVSELELLLDSKYSTYANLKKKTILPAIDYINKHTDMEVELAHEEKEVGSKKVRGVNFRIKKYNKVDHKYTISQSSDTLLSVPKIHAFEENIKYFNLHLTILQGLKNIEDMKISAGDANNFYRIESEENSERYTYLSFDKFVNICNIVQLLQDYKGKVQDPEVQILISQANGDLREFTKNFLPRNLKVA